MAEKTILDIGAEALITGLHKAVLGAGAKVARHVQTQIGDGAAALEKAASCNCEPSEVTGRNAEGVEVTVLAHAKSCPAR